MGILDGIVDWLATQIMNLLDLLSSSVLGALGCDMSTFKRYFPAAETMYEIFVWLGVGLLLLNLVWSLFKNYAAGLDVETEDPEKLLFRSGVFLLCIWYADDIVNLALRIGGTPYHWVLDSDLPAVQFGSFNSVLLVIIGVLANGSVALIALILPYNMRDVAALLPLHIRRRRAVSIDADCPFCGDTKGKLNINFEKQVFNCNRCRTHGGMVELYAKFFGVSNTQANAEIFSIVCRHETPRIAPTPIASPKELPKEASRADAQAIDQTFRTLLAMLPLAESHRSDLYRRGLNDDQIEQYLYRSVPAFGYRALTGQLLQMGCHLEGVPGFYQDEQKDWTLACSPRRTGYFVPVISVDGLLQGCQIRMDHPGKQGGKYIWLSSAERNGGVTSGSPVHFVGDPAADTVWITEGPLKATVAHCLSGHSFLAVAGANQLNGLPDSLSLLKRFGCRTVCEAFDMDKLQNPHVANGTAKVLELAKNMGFSVRQIRWNPQYKGIDDYLLSKQKNV